MLTLLLTSSQKVSKWLYSAAVFEQNWGPIGTTNLISPLQNSPSKFLEHN